MQWSCQQLELFDANKRLLEIHGMHEMLLQVQAGTLTQELLMSGSTEDEEPFDNHFEVKFVVKKPRRKGKPVV